MNEETIKTKDLILASFLKLKGHTLSIQKEGEIGVFIFNSSAKKDMTDFYNNDNPFKQFHNNIRDLKQFVKSL